MSDGVYELFPHAWVKVIAIDEEPLHPEQFLRISQLVGGSSSDFVTLSAGQSFVFEAYGNLQDIMHYTIRTSAYPDSIIEFLAHDILSPGFDTTSYQLHY